MNIVTVSLPAARVEAGDVVCGLGNADLASQTLRFIDDDGDCVLVMTLVWPHGTLACPTVLAAARSAGERD